MIHEMSWRMSEVVAVNLRLAVLVRTSDVDFLHVCPDPRFD